MTGEPPASNDPAPPPTRPPSRFGSVGLSSTGVFVITIAIQLLGYLPTHFFAQHVGSAAGATGGYPGQAVLGTFQLFLLIASSINMVGDLRVGTAFVFFVARGEKPEVGTGTYLVLRFVMVAIAGAAVLAVAAPAGWTTSQDIGIFSLWMLLPVLWSVSTVYSQLLAAQGRSTYGQVPSLVESVVRVAALTFVAVGSLSLATTAFSTLLLPITLCYLVGAAASAVYSFPAVWRYTRAFSGGVAKRLFGFAWPLMGSLLLLYFATTLIQFIVVADYGTGAYNVFLSANGFRILALAIPSAVAVPLFPHLTGLHHRRDYEVLRHRTWAALRYTAMVAIPTAMTLVIYRVNFENTLYAGTYTGRGHLPCAARGLGRARVVEPDHRNGAQLGGPPAPRALPHLGPVRRPARGVRPPDAAGERGGSQRLQRRRHRGPALGDRGARREHLLHGTPAGGPDPPPLGGHPDDLGGRELPRGGPVQLAHPGRQVLSARGGGGPRVHRVRVRPRGGRGAVEEGRRADRRGPRAAPVGEPWALEALLAGRVLAGEPARGGNGDRRSAPSRSMESPRRSRPGTRGHLSRSRPPVVGLR